VVETILEKIHAKRDLWLSYLYSWGCNPDTANDLISEMYVKVYNYIKNTNSDIAYDGDDVNIYFIYITLRNMFYDLKRKEKRNQFVDDYDFTQIEEEIEYPYINEDDYEKHCAIIDWFEDNDFFELSEKEDYLLEYDRRKLSKYYLRKIFEEVFFKQQKVTTLSRNTNITYWTLRNTIKVIKKQIKNNYEIRRLNRKDNDRDRD
jgi:DNA-directed RNA polymerase specialized sigma24 family protein